ncbi:hypothetical protein GCM10009623_01040 [Nocardioides aestuarii]
MVEPQLTSLESVLSSIEAPEPPGDERLCPADLGTRWLVVTESKGDLTGVAVDDFGCEDVRLTDDPLHVEPGEASQPGTPSGTFASPAGLLDTVKALYPDVLSTG